MSKVYFKFLTIKITSKFFQLQAIFHVQLVFFKLQVMEQLHLAPSMYLATAVEVVRRKAFSRNFLLVIFLDNHFFVQPFLSCPCSFFMFVDFVTRVIGNIIFDIKQSFCLVCFPWAYFV